MRTTRDNHQLSCTYSSSIQETFLLPHFYQIRIIMSDTGRQSATDKFTAAVKVSFSQPYITSSILMNNIMYSPTLRSQPQSIWVICSKARPTTWVLLLSLRLAFILIFSVEYSSCNLVSSRVRNLTLSSSVTCSVETLTRTL